MIKIENTLISEYLLEKKFVCDLSACKGACCVEGDSGAPLEKKELKELEDVYEKVKPYMRKEGIKAVEEQGIHLVDGDGDHVTPLVDGKECAFVDFDEKGVAKCTIEKAYRDGKTNFKKPLSCELYPVRIQEYTEFDAVNYNKWSICDPACQLGEHMNVKVYRFLKDALIRKYGEKWFKQLELADELKEKKEKQEQT